MRRVLPVLLLIACKHEPEADPPTLTIISPEDGAMLDTSEVQLSIIVENFELVPVGGDGDRKQAPGGQGNNEGTAEGFAEVTLDGVFAFDMEETQGTLTVTEVGEHTVDVELLYEDGDPLEPAVTVSASFTYAPPE